MEQEKAAQHVGFPAVLQLLHTRPALHAEPGDITPKSRVKYLLGYEILIRDIFADRVC